MNAFRGYHFFSFTPCPTWSLRFNQKAPATPLKLNYSKFFSKSQLPALLQIKINLSPQHCPPLREKTQCLSLFLCSKVQASGSLFSKDSRSVKVHSEILPFQFKYFRLPSLQLKTFQNLAEFIFTFIFFVRFGNLPFQKSTVWKDSFASIYSSFGEQTTALKIKGRILSHSTKKNTGCYLITLYFKIGKRRECSRS